ncbi:Conserved phage-associated protein, partial [Candidatus Arthromitus sp. SFB-5]
YALTKALSGEEYKGFKLVEGRSNRTFNIDDSKVLEILKGGGFKESEVCETTLKSLSSLEKMIGKKDFKTMLGSHVIKPMGKPTLVPIDDVRPVYNSAVNDFNNI